MTPELGTGYAMLVIFMLIVFVGITIVWLERQLR
jgi:cbb3-type cytochrome oxidase subunit 3